MAGAHLVYRRDHNRGPAWATILNPVVGKWFLFHFCSSSPGIDSLMMRVEREASMGIEAGLGPTAPSAPCR